MIIDNMTPDEVFKEAFSDYKEIYPKFKKAIKNKCKFIGGDFRKYTFTSKNHNEWIILKDIKNPFILYTKIETAEGRQILTYDHAIKRIHLLTHHFLERLEQRAYIPSNFSKCDYYVWDIIHYLKACIVPICENNRIIGVNTKGIIVMDEYDNLTRYVTFISKETLNNKQLELYNEYYNAVKIGENLIQYKDDNKMWEYIKSQKDIIKNDEYCLYSLINFFETHYKLSPEEAYKYIKPLIQ